MTYKPATSPQAPLLLDLSMIQRRVDPAYDVDIVVLPSVDSTNNYLMASQHLSSRPLICFAEQQTHGRGRFDRIWYSPYAENIYCSCLVSLQKNINELAGLSLVVSLATVCAIASYFSSLKLAIKWPNDILHAGRKLAGHLLEVKSQSANQCAVIIGIGINVNMIANTHERISQAWTSLQQITGEYVDRNKLAILLVNQLFNDLAIYESQGFAFFAEKWRHFDALQGQKIEIDVGGIHYAGDACGIDDDGNLQLVLPNGSIKVFTSGEATILKTDKNSLACR